MLQLLLVNKYIVNNLNVYRNSKDLHPLIFLITFDLFLYLSVTFYNKEIVIRPLLPQYVSKLM